MLSILTLFFAVTICKSQITNYSSKTSLSPTANPTQNPTSCNEGYRVHYVGKSTKFNLLSNCPNDNWQICVEMLTLVEYEVKNGNTLTGKHVPSFASTKYFWEIEQRTTYNNTPVLLNKFISQVYPKGGGSKFTNKMVEFNLTTIVYEKDSNVTYGGHKRFIKGGTLEWTIELSSWPFASLDTSTLGLSIRLTTSGTKKFGGKTTIVNSNILYSFGDGFYMESPSYSIVDNTNRHVNITISNGSSSDVRIEFVFPAYRQSLYYDPFIGIIKSGPTSSPNGRKDSSSSKSLSGGEIAGIIVGTIMGISLLCIICFFGVRHIYKQKYPEKYHPLVDSNHEYS